jgi:hypothetical protein
MCEGHLEKRSCSHSLCAASGVINKKINLKREKPLIGLQKIGNEFTLCIHTYVHS